MKFDLSDISYEQTPITGVVFSQYANLFPMIEGRVIEDLRSDIVAHGVREPIVFMQEQILDGRNRYIIARELGLEYPRQNYIGDDPLAFVLSKNLHRRQLNEGQRAMVASKLAKLPAYRPAGSTATAVVTQDLAAKAFDVSVDSVQRARVIQEQAIPEVISKVESGEVSVSAAAVISSLSADEQADIIRSADPRAFARVAKEIRAEKQAGKKANRVAREVSLGDKQRNLPDAKFGVIYADPEWKFVPYSLETGMDRSAENHYPTSPTDVISERPVQNISADDCILFLWATSPMLKDALSVMEAWGFEYKSQCVWYKIRPGEARGPGYWFTNEHEILLLGTRGNIPCPAPGTQWLSVIEAPIGEHSAKPEIFAEMIEEYFPSLPKIELNRRGAPREGWAAWGNEVEEAA